MPTRPEGVYKDSKGGWYVKITVGRDPLSGKRDQITRRGFTTASEAARARRELLAKVDRKELRPIASGITLGELLDEYLDGLDADGKLSAKTRHDYREYVKDYVRPHLGNMKVRSISGETIQAWQRKLSTSGANRQATGADGKLLPAKGLAPNTIRLARTPLSGALKLAVEKGIIGVNPTSSISRPTPKRSIPKHWSPEEARRFLSLMEGDRIYPIWAFLMGSGLRIGELVRLRWKNVDLEAKRVRVVDFVSVVNHKLIESSGKSKDAVRTIKLDDSLVGVLELQRQLQANEASRSDNYVHTDYVFTKENGDHYHPQWLSRTLGNITQELGLPRLTARGLRHTSATLMLAEGVHAKIAAERLGHANPALFTNLYSHVTETMQDDAANKIGAALFGKGG